MVADGAGDAEAGGERTRPLDVGSAMPDTVTPGKWVNAGRWARSVQRPAPTMPIRMLMRCAPAGM